MAKIDNPPLLSTAPVRVPVSSALLLTCSTVLLALTGCLLLQHTSVATIILRHEPLRSVSQFLQTIPQLALLSVAVFSSLLSIIGAIVLRGGLKHNALMAHLLHVTEINAYREQEKATVTLGSITDAVICLSQDLRITYLNRAAEGLLRKKASVLEGQLFLESVQFVKDADARAIAVRLCRALSGGESGGDIFGVLLRRADHSEIAVNERIAPMRDRDGRILGIVLVLRDITEERALTMQLQHQANHDVLTGLLNRSAFEVQLESVLHRFATTGTQSALLYFDLDQFKVVNDTCGHAAGDALIHRIGWLVKETLREGDSLARLGGDEFAAIICGVSVEDALVLAERIRRKVEELRFQWESQYFTVTSSIGVLAITHPMLPSEALAAVDQACYTAKDSGRNRVQLYCAQDIKERHQQMGWVARINDALEHDRLRLYAQKIVPIASAPAGREPHREHYELLLRMLSPQGELIPPMSFIPAAERYGLMTKLDRWVIATACEKLSALRGQGRGFPTCLINLSGASVTDPKLIEFIRESLNKNSLPAESLGFELTETTAVSNLASAAKLMRELKALGCKLALDDFGSGMSSFSYLKALPLDSLKIDGAFIREITTDRVDFALVEAIQRVAQVLGIATVAECVETQEAFAALALIGVDFVQGLHVHEPAPIEQLETQRALRPALATREADALKRSA